MKKHTRLPLLAMMLVPIAVSASDLDAITANCNGCHGDDGVSKWSDVPTIAGIDAFVHSEALYVYQDEARPCAESKYRQGDTGRAATTMCAVAAALADEDIEAASAHYAELPFVPAKQNFDAALASAGEAIHEKECSRCHSDGGSNPEDEASILAGQWMDYLKTSFAQFKSGDREKPKQGMEKIAALSDDDVKALLHYYASQQ